MQLPPNRLTQHRYARLVAWALCVLAWVASMIAGGRMTARHAKQRDWYFGLDGLSWLVRTLIVMRAARLARLRSRRIPRTHGRGGPQRNIHLIRAAAGSRLRRALRHGDEAARISILIHALNNIDAFATRLVARFKRRLTRLLPILTTPQAAHAVRTLAAPRLIAADSS